MTPHSPLPACPECGQLVRPAGNAFFGIGLSVHRYVKVCPECYWTEFVRGGPDRVEDANDIATPPRFLLFIQALWARTFYRGEAP